MRECPICMCEKPDVEQLVHLSSTVGDVGSHCMCGSCREAFEGFSCPWCRGKIGGLITPAISTFVKDFVSRILHDAKKGDQHQHATWLEQWEAFEFEHGNFITDAGVQMHDGRPDVVANTARLVVQDARFKTLIEEGIRKAIATSDGNTWLCNGAGVIFRLHGLLKQGSLAVSPELGALLDRAHGAILTALDKPSYSAANLGCIYMQAVSAWLSACRCGSGDTAADAETVRRVGTAVRCIIDKNSGKRGELRSHVVEFMVRAATEPVWGGADKDAVLKVTYGC